MTEFEKALRDVINTYSRESESDTPDFVLAQYLSACLLAFDAAVRKRDQWKNKK